MATTPRPGTRPPNNPSRTKKHPLDKHLYAQRHPIECCYSKLKQFRREATRCEKKDVWLESPGKQPP